MEREREFFWHVSCLLLNFLEAEAKTGLGRHAWVGGLRLTAERQESADRRALLARGHCSRATPMRCAIVNDLRAARSR